MPGLIRATTEPTANGIVIHAILCKSTCCSSRAWNDFSAARKRAEPNSYPGGRGFEPRGREGGDAHVPARSEWQGAGLVAESLVQQLPGDAEIEGLVSVYACNEGGITWPDGPVQLIRHPPAEKLPLPCNLQHHAACHLHARSGGTDPGSDPIELTLPRACLRRCAEALHCCQI